MKEKPFFKFLKVILIWLNMVAAAALVLSLSAGHIAPSKATFFAVFGLFYPILFFVNLFFVIIWLMVRSYWILLSASLLILGFGNLKTLFPLNVFSESKTELMPIKVLTYNIQNFRAENSDTFSLQVKQNIVDFVLKKNPQIVCFQEFQSRDQQLYEPLKEMKNQLQANSYYFESYFNPRYNEYLAGLAIFTKYDAINKGKLKFEGSRTFGIFTDLIIGADTVRVYNIHLASIQLKDEDIDFVVNPDMSDNEKLKLKSLKIYRKLRDAFRLREKQLHILLDQLTACPYPVILCGDFNDTPSSYTYHQLVKYLSDTFIEEGTGPSWSYAGQLPFLRIDYILKSAEFTTLDYTLFKVDYSDHFPVCAQIKKSNLIIPADQSNK